MVKKTMKMYPRTLEIKSMAISGRGGARPGAGRPKGSTNADPTGAYAALEAARRACPKAVKRILELMDSENEAIALKASEAVLDRGLGKPAQSVDVTTQGDKISQPQILVTLRPNHTNGFAPSTTSSETDVCSDQQSH